MNWLALVVVAALLAHPSVASGAAPAQAPTPTSAASPAEAPKDTLGRETPRGTLFGFMTAARKSNFDLAALYLNTHLRDRAAAELASQLFVVLDTRLPARLQEVSDRPDGSRANPLRPDQDIVGTIDTASGPLDIVVERVTRGPTGRGWLFSRRTLDAIPAVYDEIQAVPAEHYLPQLLIRPHFFGIRLFDWLALLIALPLLYAFLGLVRRTSVGVPGPVRLIIIGVAVRWLVSTLELPLIERQFWTVITAMMFVSGVVWLLVQLTRVVEERLLRRLGRTALGDTTSLLRVARWTVDFVIIIAGLLTALRYFGVDPTAALAGLGIGGIAVALAAQKTLENLIGGLSIIFDRAVRVGDFLKIGTTTGTVEYVGLRSTRIRTLDRTILSVPNGQLATVNIETFTDRDKFRFSHIVGVTYGTSAEQLRRITGDIRDLLRKHPRADDSSIRVCVVRLGQSSIDIEVTVYLFAQDWENFVALQEALLFDVMEIVERHGSSIAFPTQTVQVVGSSLPTADLLSPR